MDVHAPHQPIHSARDFFLHLFTITVGLLIALGLEAAAEHIHNRHLLHTAESNLRSELHDNRDLMSGDERHLDLSQKQIQDGLTMLDALKAHQATTGAPNPNWQWSSPQAAAWDTARDSGALALMSYTDAESYNVIYGQQKSVNDQATLYIRDIYSITAPLEGGRTAASLTPAQLDTMIAASHQTLADLSLLRDLCRSLDHIYARNASL